MNRIGLIAMLAALTVTSVHAATRYDPAIPSGLAVDQPAPPSVEVSKPQATPAPQPPRLIQNEKRHMRDADARACLDQATSNKGIHRCSLKYRSHASRGEPVKKASRKPAAEPPPAAVAPIEMTKPPASAGKPAAVKPADAAKAADLVKPVDVTKAAAVPKAADAPKAAETPKPEAAKAAPAAPTPPTPPPPPAKAPEAAKK